MFEGNMGDYARGAFDGSVVCTIRSVPEENKSPWHRRPPENC